jgi:hypothetical protein
MNSDSPPCPSSPSDSPNNSPKPPHRSILSRIQLHFSPKHSSIQQPDSNTGNQPTQVPARRSILSLVNLNLSPIISRASKSAASCISCKIFVRGLVSTGLFLLSLILVVIRLVEAEKCADEEMHEGVFGYMILNAVLATFTKLFLMSLSILNSTQIKISDEQIYFSKSISGVFYCSHILPVLIYAPDSCDRYDLIPEEVAEYSILIPIGNTVLYILIAIGITTLCLCSKSNRIVPKRFDVILWWFIRSVTIVFCVLTVGVLMIGSVLLYYLEKLVFVEITSLIYYGVFTICIAYKNKRCLFSYC